MAPTNRRPRNRPNRTRTRKRDRDIKALPEADDNAEPGDLNGSTEERLTINGVDSTNEGIAKSRKRKREEGIEGGNETATPQDQSSAAPNKNKSKNKKGKRKQGNDGNEGEGGEGDDDTAKSNQQRNKKADRFIVFVGNLPYDTTQASLSAHLAPVKPTSVRVATLKPGETRKSRSRGKPKPASTTDGGEGTEPTCKGYAFVEFSDVGRMKTCLTLFHHSTFNGRKINVELTAGGGGKSEDRKEKVRAKNEKLNEERKKRFEEDKKKKEEAKKKKAESGEVEEEEKKEEEENHDGIHPSRRKRVKR
ncbi:hypothetical protein AA313_de0201175 [Arthrobotrys entomopaga]|nr:hypothetical protein AA313_de0201175 [Arthrobotrys entomopaga]